MAAIRGVAGTAGKLAVLAGAASTAVVRVIAIAFAAFLWPETVDAFHVLNQHRAIDKRGLTTTATVLSYSCDPDGGDPDGWTTDRVRFATTGGTTVVTTVGHHSAGPERTSRIWP